VEAADNNDDDGGGDRDHAYALGEIFRLGCALRAGPGQPPTLGRGCCGSLRGAASRSDIIRLAARIRNDRRLRSHRRFRRSDAVGGGRRTA
jgi:hypothetical protein